MSDPLCIIVERGQQCDRPCWDQAYMCEKHGEWLTRELGKLPYLTEELDVVRARDVAGTTRVGTVATKGTPLPFDSRVSDVESALTNSLTTWARLVAEERGVLEPEPDGAPDGPRCEAGIGCKHTSCAAIRAQRRETDAEAAARWLIGHVRWIRHQQAADQCYDDLRRVITAAENLVDKRAPRLYLGPCDAERTPDGDPLEQPCERDIYAPLGVDTVTCPTCAAQHNVKERRDAIVARADNHAASAAEISAFCYAMFGEHVSTAAIRGYYRLGKIQRHGTARDPRGKIVPAYKIGEVVNYIRRLADKSDELAEAVKMARKIEGEDKKARKERHEARRDFAGVA